MPTYFPPGQSWASLNRSERSFCAALYRHELATPGSLVQAITRNCKLPPKPGSTWHWSNATTAKVPTASTWEAALEACFFRDMYSVRPAVQKPPNFNALAQTTFDLALFSDHTIIVIEAKGIESFSTAQLSRIVGIKAAVTALTGNAVQVFVYGLISSKYLNNISGRKVTGSLHHLDGLMAWHDLAAFYGACPMLAQAERIYGT